MKLHRFHPPLIAVVLSTVLLIVNFPIPKATESGIPVTEYGTPGFILSCVALALTFCWFLYLAFGPQPPKAKKSKSKSRKGKKRR